MKVWVFTKMLRKPLHCALRAEDVSFQALAHMRMRKDKCAPDTRKSERDSNSHIRRETGTWLFATESVSQQFGKLVGVF